MGSVPPLVAYLLMIVSGWVHRRQLIVIEYLQAENRLLRARLSGKRVRFTDAERALLARKAKAVDVKRCWHSIPLFLRIARCDGIGAWLLRSGISASGVVPDVQASCVRSHD